MVSRVVTCCALTLMVHSLVVASQEPVVSAKSAIIIEQETGKVLWSKDPHVKRYPASTTKILTGLLLIERCRPDEIITAPKDVESVGEASLHLKPGEKVKATDMLKALMLRSANDACYAVACHISGSVKEFAALMNKRAKELGCLNTNFTNPNGLNDAEHVTTAYDLAQIARQAMKDPSFQQVAQLQHAEIERSINKKDRVLVNKNKLLKLDCSVTGVKTGYTRPAGKCFVGSAHLGFKVITVVLGSDDWVKDTQTLLQYARENYQVQPSTMLTVTIPIKSKVSFPPELAGASKLPVVTFTDFLLLRKNEELVWTAHFPKDLQTPIVKGQKLGYWESVDSDGFVRRVNGLAFMNLDGDKPSITFTQIRTIVGILMGCGLCFLMIKRKHWA